MQLCPFEQVISFGRKIDFFRQQKIWTRSTEPAGPRLQLGGQSDWDWSYRPRTKALFLSGLGRKNFRPAKARPKSVPWNLRRRTRFFSCRFVFVSLTIFIAIVLCWFFVNSEKPIFGFLVLSASLQTENRFGLAIFQSCPKVRPFVSSIFAPDLRRVSKFIGIKLFSISKINS